MNLLDKIAVTWYFLAIMTFLLIFLLKNQEPTIVEYASWIFKTMFGFPMIIATFLIGLRVMEYTRGFTSIDGCWGYKAEKEKRVES